MSHWHAPSGSGPMFAGTEYSAEQGACSPGTVLTTVVRCVNRVGSLAPPPNHPFGATPTTAPEVRSACSNDGFFDVAVAMPSLLRLTTVPPAFWIAASPRGDCPSLRTTMYFCAF